MQSLTALFLLSLAIAFTGVACDSPMLPDPAPAQVPVKKALTDAAALIAQEEFVRASDLLAPLFLANPTDRQLNFLYGKALLHQHRASRAAWHLQRTAQSDEPSFESISLYVQALAWGGAERDAIEAATAFLEKHPKADAVRYQRSVVLPAELRYEEALEDLDILLDHNPKSMRLRQSKLDILEKLKRFDEARDLLADVGKHIEESDASPATRRQFCVSRGQFEIRHKDYDRARAVLEECLAASPNDPDSVFSMVDLLEAIEKSDQATRVLEEAANRNPGRLRLQLRLATRYQRLGRSEDAEKVLLRSAERIGTTQSWLSLADFRINANDVEGAVEAIDKAILQKFDIDPADPSFDWGQIPAESAFAFGDIFIRAKQFDRVQAIIDSIDEKAYALLLTARLQLTQGDPRAALSTYDEAFKYFPSNAGARYLAAIAAIEIGEFERGASLYQDALRFDSAANDAGLVLARMQIAQSLPGASVDTLSYYLAGHPDEPHALQLFGQATFELGMREPSQTARARLDEMNHWAGMGAADFARNLAYAKGTEEALTFLESQDSLFTSSNFEVLSAWVAVKNAAGEGPEAKKRIGELVKAEPDAAGFRIVLGRLRVAEEDDEAALESFAKAVEFAPDLVAAQNGYGKSLAKAERRDEAIEAYDRANTLDPLNPESAFAAALLVIGTEPFEEAETRLEDILRAHPWHGGAALELSKLLGKRGEDPERERILANQARLFLRFSGAEAFFVIADLQAEDGDYPNAIANYRGAIDRGYDPPRARFEFARALAHENLREAAIDQLEQAIRVGDFPELEEAKQMLSQLAEPTPPSKQETD